MTLIPFEPRRKAVTQKSGSHKPVSLQAPKLNVDVGGHFMFNMTAGPPYQEPPRGTVLKVSGELQGSEGVARGRVYDYAVIRANNGRWYTSGSTCPVDGYSWQGLLQFLATFRNAKGVRLC